MKMLNNVVLIICAMFLILGAGHTISADESGIIELTPDFDLTITDVTMTPDQNHCNWIYWVITVENIGVGHVDGSDVVVKLNLNGVWVTGSIQYQLINEGATVYYFLTTTELSDGTYTAYVELRNAMGDTTFFDADTDNNVYDDIPVFTVECFDNDFGDAPEGINPDAIAYPSTMTPGSFPTCVECGPSGYISHIQNGMFFGPLVDNEIEGNGGLCPNGFPLYDQDESYMDGDAGLLIPDAFTIDDTNVVVPIKTGMTEPLGYPGQLAIWGLDIDIDVTNTVDSDAFVNMLIDWNQDGDWMDDGEHVLINHLVPTGYSGPLSAISDSQLSFTIFGQQPGYVWVRFTITKDQLDQDWFGEGDFADGETEDYLLKIIEKPDESVHRFYPNAEIPPGCTMTASDGVESYFNILLENVPSGYDMGDGIYAGWCFEKEKHMTRNTPLPVALCHSYDPDMPSEFKHTNWDMINYMINHKDGYTMEDIQQAVWWILEGFTPTSSGAQALVADIVANGDGYAPVAGELLAVLIFPDDQSIQNTFIEVPLDYSSCPPEFWEENPDDWPTGFDPSQMISLYFSVEPSHDITLAEALATIPWNEPYYYPDSTILSNPTALRENLLRQAVAALLNCNSNPCVHYPLTHHQILVLINDVLNDPWNMYISNLWLSMYNQIGCEPGCCPCSEPLQQ